MRNVGAERADSDAMLIKDADATRHTIAAITAKAKVNFCDNFKPMSYR
jgi:hypothetical protein